MSSETSNEAQVRLDGLILKRLSEILGQSPIKVQATAQALNVELPDLLLTLTQESETSAKPSKRTPAASKSTPASPANDTPQNGDATTYETSAKLGKGKGVRGRLYSAENLRKMLAVHPLPKQEVISYKNFAAYASRFLGMEINPAYLNILFSQGHFGEFASLHQFIENVEGEPLDVSRIARSGARKKKA